MFLESKHVKSINLQEHVRMKVLEYAKEALAWRFRTSTSAEVKAKIEELNTFMSKVISGV